jgi:predicted transcriptional regulator
MAPRKQKKLEPITIRFEPGTRAELEKLAAELDRPLAWVVNRALAQWLAGKGLDRSRVRGSLD